jgi:hypothetical protein
MVLLLANPLQEVVMLMGLFPVADPLATKLKLTADGETLTVRALPVGSSTAVLCLTFTA